MIAVVILVAEYFRLTQAQARETAYEVAKAVSRWRQEATSLGIPAAETEIVASAFEHEDLAQARNLKISSR